MQIQADIRLKKPITHHDHAFLTALCPQIEISENNSHIRMNPVDTDFRAFYAFLQSKDIESGRFFLWKSSREKEQWNYIPENELFIRC